MKKTIISLFLFLILLTVKTSDVNAQSDCSYECRVETSSICIACRNSSGGTTTSTTTNNDPCSFSCRVETSSACVACRNPGGSQTNNNASQDSCSFACRVETSSACVACRNQSNSGGSTNTSGGGKTSDPTCMGGNGINTAIGCIPISDTNAFMGWVLGWAIGVGGGIAFLLIVYASFMVMTSAGVPDRLKAGQELLTSAISGLIMLIFSVFILKFIGIDILGLGSLGFGV